jgi:hypothetical protein
MNVIVMGFYGQDRKADRTVLYAGADKDTARTALETGAEGIVRTEMYVNPQHHQRRSFSSVPEVVATAPEPEATVKESLTVEPEPESGDEPEPLKLPSKKGK